MRMKKAFTLVELLVVTLIIAILAGIVFRLAGASNDSAQMQTTILHMQRLENCLSGYYAAFGSYPPVELQGSRNPFYPVNQFGYIQQTENMDPDYSKLDPARVKAACMAQPVAAEFPFMESQDQEMAKHVSDTIQELLKNEAYAERYGTCAAANPFDGLATPQQLNSKKGEYEWDKIQLFKFGLMSYLVPRYLMMMGHSYNSMYREFFQWDGNNSRPCRFEDGVQYPSWEALNQDLRQNANEKWKIDLIPSQAITQRWLPNLEGICKCGATKTFYGILLGGGDALDPEHPDTIVVYSSGDSQSGENASGTQLYVLDSITVQDGWGQDLYYYSPPPYQSYRLWSAGPNGQTFPPWITDEQIRNDPDLKSHAKTIRAWIADDVVHLSH